MRRKSFVVSVVRTLLVSLLLLGMVAGCSPDVPEQEEQPPEDVSGETEKIEEEVPLMYDQKAIVILHQPGKAAAYQERLVASLRTVAAEVTVADWNTVTDDAFDAQKTAVLILTGANRVEGTLLEKAEKFQKKGGHLIALGGPLCEDIAFQRAGGKYSTFNEFMTTSDDVHLQIDFEDDKQVAKIGRNANNPSVKRKITTGDYGLDRTSLKLENGYYEGWDLMTIPMQVEEDDNMLCFYAKASGAKTMYIEIVMADGTRWLGPTLQTSEDWTFYTIQASEFHFYSGSSQTLAFEEVNTLWIGGTSLNAGEGYTLYLDSLATGAFTADPVAEVAGLTDYDEFYRITNGARMEAYAGQAVVDERTYTLPGSVYSTLRAMESTGVSKGRTSRFVPLIEVFDEKELHSGYAAWLNLYNKGSLAAFPVGDAFFDDSGVAAVQDVVAFLLGGTRLTEAGTAQYVYEADAESIEAKAAYYAPGGASVRFTFQKDGEIVYTQTGEYKKTDALSRDSATMTLQDVRPDRVTVELLVGETVVDQITHPILCLGETDTATESFVTVKDGVFQKDGKPLQLVGINYFGSYGGIVPSSSFTSNAVYDPYLVMCDLLRIKEIGFNAISVQVSPWADAAEVMAGNNQNMIQVIAMARELGLYVDIYVPFVGEMSKFTSIVEALHLREFDNVVAYDIVWEGAIGTYASLTNEQKSKRDAAWIAWVKAQYGSVAAAELSFGTSCPQTADFDALLSKANASEAEARLATAYRRFMDDTVSAEYAAYAARIRTVDPNHLISFRCCDAGLPSAVNAQNYYYDFSGFCGALDFVSPEGYGFTSYQYNASAYEGAFAQAYARLVCGDTTTVWKEFGWTCYSGSNYAPMESNMNYAAQIYEKVYDAILMGTGGGSYGWWYAGGLRADEGSDYGVVNPDGSDRPATATVRAYLAQLTEVKAVGTADVVFTVDRDRYADGLRGIWNEIKDEFIAALSAGKSVALTSAGSEMSVKEAVLIALDGSDNPTAPRKYLNCVISYAADAGGKEIAMGGKSATETVTLTVANTGYTPWSEGDVALCDASGNVLATLPALSQGERAEITVTLPTGGATIRASACGVAFGNSFSIVK